MRAVIEKALELVRRGWCQRASARDAAGNAVSPMDTEACCWCLDGALLVATDSALEYLQASVAVSNALGGKGYIGWNDTPGRTQNEVVSLLERLI